MKRKCSTCGGKLNVRTSRAEGQAVRRLDLQCAKCQNREVWLVETIERVLYRGQSKLCTQHKVD